MIDFDQLKWEVAPPRTRTANLARMGMRICVYDPPKRGSPHARLFVPDPAIADVLRRHPVRFSTAWSDAHGTRAMAFELVSSSSYAFMCSPKGATVHVTFGLFAWMNPAVAAYPIEHWSWDGTRLIVLLPAGVQRDVEYDARITHVSNAVAEPLRITDATHTPAVIQPPVQVRQAVETVPVEPPVEAAPPPQLEPTPPLAVVEPVAEPAPVAPPEPPRNTEAQLNALAKIAKVKRAPTKQSGRAAQADREARLTTTNRVEPIFKPRELSAAEREAATVEVRRARKVHRPVVLPERKPRPETDATRLQASCRVLQLDPELRPEVEGATLITTRGHMWLKPVEMRVITLMTHNVNTGHGATGITEIHNARWRPGDEEKSLSKLSDTEDWLADLEARLTDKVGICFRVHNRLYALDAATNGETQ